MNAIDMLKEDHRVVDGLFKEVENTPPSRHPGLFKRIKGELDTHAHLEEKVFYPELKKRGNKELVDMVLEGLEEHSQMKKFLREIDAITVKNETYEPKLKVLIEDTRHHVKEEDRMRTGMFSMAESQLGEAAMEKLGTRMEAERKKFQTAKGIKPEKREAAKSSLGSLVEKARDVVVDLFAGGTPDTPKPKTPAKARSNGSSNGKPPPKTANTAKAAAKTTVKTKAAPKAKAALPAEKKESKSPRSAG